ncbi:MAG: hypothetical protein R6V55_13880 [Desulfovermiculus sp.]
MSTTSAPDCSQDREIIELTDVVEEPIQPAAGEPKSSEASQPERPQGTTSRESGQPSVSGPSPETEKDEFDFSSLWPETQSFGHKGAGGTLSDSSTAWTDSQSAHADDFNDLDDLFDELDLDLAPDQDKSSASHSKDHKSPSGSEEQIQAINDKLQELSSRLADLESLHSLDNRVRELEQAVSSGNSEAWKDIESRIMHRLESLVHERITQAKDDLHREIEQIINQSAIAPENTSVQDLAQKVEDLTNYAVGPETVSALKNELFAELTQRIEETIPQAAAKVIREEIQSLLEEEASKEKE